MATTILNVASDSQDRIEPFYNDAPVGVALRGECLMNTIMRNVTCSLLVAASALGTGRTQSTSREMLLSGLKAQQPQETILASAPCQRARENSPRVGIVRNDPIDPKTLIADLGSLMEKSDEVILAGSRDSAMLLSPSGVSTATYREITVIHSWKGPHRPGDVFTFGVPGGLIECALPGHKGSFFWVQPGGNDWLDPISGSYAYVLFLRAAMGDEAQMVQGLLPAAGHGVQGMFLIKVPFPNAERYCASVMAGTVGECDAYLETSQDPVVVPYARDPLAKTYSGMPAADFLREVRSVSAAQPLPEKTSSK
jgi:hypothetical protein